MPKDGLGKHETAIEDIENLIRQGSKASIGRQKKNI